jgi:hypothetical protein
MFGDWTLIIESRRERFTSEEFHSDTEEILCWKHKMSWIYFVIL